MTKQEFYELIEEAYDLLASATSASEDHRLLASIDALDELLAEIDDE